MMHEQEQHIKTDESQPAFVNAFFNRPPEVVAAEIKGMQILFLRENEPPVRLRIVHADPYSGEENIKVGSRYKQVALTKPGHFWAGPSQYRAKGTQFQETASTPEITTAQNGLVHITNAEQWNGERFVKIRQMDIGSLLGLYMLHRTDTSAEQVGILVPTNGVLVYNPPLDIDEIVQRGDVHPIIASPGRTKRANAILEQGLQ